MRHRIWVFATLLIIQGTIATAGDVDDRRVKEWIATSLRIQGAEIDASIDQTFTPDAVREAWQRLKRCRDVGNSFDLNLAAAEHYLFMRSVTSASGDTSYSVLPKWYETIKTAATRVSLETLLQSSSQPVSPPNARVTAWGTAGVERGLKDFTEREGKQPTASGSSLLTLFGFSYARYYFDATGAAVRSSGTCDIVALPRGRWDSTDPAHRWSLIIKGDTCTLLERSPSGGTLSREVAVRFGGNDTAKIARENDADVLTFLGFAPGIRTAVIARSPAPSYFILSMAGDTLSGTWNGLLVIKDAQGQFKELKQPGQTAAKQYDFSRN